MNVHSEGALRARIAVLVVGEDPLAWAGLASLVAGAERTAVVAQASSKDDLLRVTVLGGSPEL